jgi:hypothetical protein
MQLKFEINHHILLLTILYDILHVKIEVVALFTYFW